jgi:hypothetical protein
MDKIQAIEELLTDYAVYPDGTTWPRDEASDYHWDIVCGDDVAMLKEGQTVEEALTILRLNRIPVEEFLERHS